VVFAVAEFANRFSSFSLEVDRGGIEEDEVEAAEEVLSEMEQVFLTRKGMAALVFNLFPEECHGPVEVMEESVPAPLITQSGATYRRSGQNRERRAGEEPS